MNKLCPQVAGNALKSWLARIIKLKNPMMKYMLYVYEQGKLSGLEVWGTLGVKTASPSLKKLKLKSKVSGPNF